MDKRSKIRWAVLGAAILLTADGLSCRDRAGCTVALGIIDPLTGEPTVSLTTGRQDENGCMVVFEEKQ